MLEEEIVKKLLEKQYTVTTAESCTGGFCRKNFECSGSIVCVCEGHITYSNEAKERLLGVSHETLVRYGAVSRQTAEEMARGAAKTAKAEIGLSTTGIAGPEAEQKKSRLVLSLWDVVFSDRDLCQRMSFSWNKRRKQKCGCGSGAEIVGGKFIVIFNKENVFTEKQCFIMSEL